MRVYSAHKPIRTSIIHHGARLAGRRRRACERVRGMSEVPKAPTRIGWGGCGGNWCPGVVWSCQSHNYRHMRIGEGVTEPAPVYHGVVSSTQRPPDACGLGQGGAVHDDFVDSLTPLRLELIRAIAEDAPESMREAARLVERDVSDVHADLKQLDVLGILAFEAGGPNGAIQPVVPFDRIEVHIDYPLIDNSESDSAPVSA